MVHRYAFEEAVISHMMSDVAYGVLLSGGLDSSLCASVMSRLNLKTQYLFITVVFSSMQKESVLIFFESTVFLYIENS